MSFKDMVFKSQVYKAFPDRSSARAARFVGVSQPTMQKWMSQESDVPIDIIDVAPNLYPA